MSSQISCATPNFSYRDWIKHLDYVNLYSLYAGASHSRRLKKPYSLTHGNSIAETTHPLIGMSEVCPRGRSAQIGLFRTATLSSERRLGRRQNGGIARCHHQPLDHALYSARTHRNACTPTSAAASPVQSEGAQSPGRATKDRSGTPSGMSTTGPSKR